MFKKVLLILALMCMMVLPVFGQTGNYTSNRYFYLPEYGAYGTDEYNEYNLYMQIADTQIKANKDAFDYFTVSDITDVDLTDIANNKILKYNSTSKKWECEDDSGGGGAVTTSGTPVQYDYARFTGATTIEGRSYTEVKQDLDLEIGTDIQAYDAALASISGLTYVSPSFIKLTADDTYAVRTLAETKNDLSLNNVENTALSTWVGTENITTLGTIVTGTWQGTAIADGYIPDDITITESDPNVDTQGEIEAILTYALDDTAGDGNTNKLWSADKIFDQLALKEGVLTNEAGLYAALSDVTGFMQDGESYTNLTGFVEQTAWRLFYSNADGDIVELALGTDGKYLECNGVDAAPTWTFPAGAGDALTTDPLSQFAATTSAELAGVISDETGSGLLVYNNSPTFITPTLGTPAGGTLTSCTGLPIATGVSGLGTGVATFLATPSSANLISAVTDETGSGALVFGTSPTLVTPILGTPTSGTLTNCTFPTLNQNTTGSAATLTTPRTIGEVSFDGSANIVPNIVTDTTPELGGEMDAGAHSIGFTLQTDTGTGEKTIDWKLGNKMKFTFGADNVTFTFTAPTNPCTLMLTLIQDGIGSRTVTWPATVKWAGGVAPTLTTTANARDKVALDWDGTQYDGVCSKDFK